MSDDDPAVCLGCQRSVTSERGYHVVNGDLYRDPLCDECRTPPIEELAQALLVSAEVDEQTRVSAIRLAFDHRDPAIGSSTAFDYAMKDAGVPREDRLAVLDHLEADPARS